MKDFEIKTVPVADIELAEWNYKTNDEEMALKLQNGMEKTGYVHKIAVAIRDEDPKGKYEVIDGNHRLMAFRNMKVEAVQCIFVGRLRRTARQRLGIELNELKFKSDNIKLAELFAEMSKDYDLSDLASTMPYSENEIEDFTKLLDHNWDQYDQGNSVPDDQQEDWVDFSFGEIKGKAPISVYTIFGQAIQKLQASGVTDFPHQIEFLAVNTINEPRQA